MLHEQSNTVIHAEPGVTVSRATMRPQDLIPTFLEVIKETPEYLQLMFQVNPPEHISLIQDPTDDDQDPRWESEDMICFLNETLWDILNNYAPDGYCFGSHPGDGSDYAYWRIDNWPMEKGKNYKYSTIEEKASWDSFETEDIGINLIGQNFLVLTNEDITISFVLTGTMGDQYIYECIYTDEPEI